MGMLLCRLLSVALVIAAIANFSTVFASSPAFNEEARLESVVGGWRVPNAAAHYDKAEYLLELGFTYLNELGLTVDPDTGELTILEIDALEARTQKALELLDQSLRLDPANASAWAYLAQAQGRSNDLGALRDSLARSWMLAPNNLQLAPLRLQLVSQVYFAGLDAPAQMAPLSEQEIASARRDAMVLAAQLPAEFESLIPDEDPFRAVLGEAQGPLSDG